jgi:hypothetical protein
VLVAGDRAGALARIDLAGTSEPQILTGHTQTVHTLAFDRTGELAVSGSFDRTARVWRLDGRAPPRVFEGDLFPAAVALDGPLLAVGRGAGVELVHLESGARATLRFDARGRAGFAVTSEERACLLGDRKAARRLVVRREGSRCAPLRDDDVEPRTLAELLGIA